MKLKNKEKEKYNTAVKDALVYSKQSALPISSEMIYIVQKI
jgi:hypothetical protein